MTGDISGREAARQYILRDWSVIPLGLREKNPNRKGWQTLRIALDEVDAYFSDRPQNIGLQTGEPSSWIVDVDLDSPETRSVHDRFLPDTGAKYGRASTPISHLLYQSTGPIATAKFQDPTKEVDDE